LRATLQPAELPLVGLALFLPGAALAQSLSLDLGQGGTVSGQIVRLVLLVTVLSLAPSLLVMVTSFTRIVIVLSFLRTAIGLQQTPPNPVLMSLALFLTLFIMAPTFETVSRDSLARHLAAVDGIRLLEIRSTVGPAEDANNWREYLGRADDLLATFSAETML